MARKVLSTVADIAGAVSGIWDIVEKIQANIQAARNETERALNSVADVGTIAKATGLGDRRVQQYQYAFARGAGLSAQESSRALFQATGVLGRARQGDDDAMAVVKRLGIASSREGLAGISTDSFLRKALEGLASQSDVTQRSADSAAMFGAEPGAKLSASAGELVSQFDKLVVTVHELGVVLSGDAIAVSEKAARANDLDASLADKKKQAEILRDITGREVREAPEFADKAAALRKEIEGYSSKRYEEIQNVLQSLVNTNHDSEAAQKIISDILKDYGVTIAAATLELTKLRTDFAATMAAAANGSRSAGGPEGHEAGVGGYPGGQLLEARAGGGPVSAYAPYMVGERGAELFVPRSAGTIVSNRALGASQWPWSASNPEVGAAKDAIGEFQTLLDELDFDWQGTFNRMTDVLLDFAETGKFEWRDMAKIALDAIEQMLMGWAELQAQQSGQSGGKKSGWATLAQLAYTAASAYFGGGSSAPSATASAGGYNASGLIAWSGKAAGGPVAAFTPYMVGERGPELFMPRVPGAIVPNHELGGATRGGEGGRPVIVNLNGSPGVPEAVRREVALTPGLAVAA